LKFLESFGIFALPKKLLGQREVRIEIVIESGYGFAQQRYAFVGFPFLELADAFFITAASRFWHLLNKTHSRRRQERIWVGLGANHDLHGDSFHEVHAIVFSKPDGLRRRLKSRYSHRDLVLAACETIEREVSIVVSNLLRYHSPAAYSEFDYGVVN